MLISVKHVFNKFEGGKTLWILKNTLTHSLRKEN